jgi:ubiquinone/menaquinone biosynthesis C-methylase UbiE
MSLLDCGCGPGTITTGLAEFVFPGRVSAIDLKQSQIEATSSLSVAAGLSNVDCKVGSIYQLPFESEAFDAVFVHAVLQHLQDPLAALREVYRVLRRNGFVGVRDDDQGSLIVAPADPKMDRAITLIKQRVRESGGNPSIGRYHRELLFKAGFARVIGSATVECDGSLEATTNRGDLAAKLLEQMCEPAVSRGWTNLQEMKELIVTCREWGRKRDAYDAVIWCEAVAWKE